MSVKRQLDEQMVEKLVSLLNDLEFGMIQITVHDSQITQIDRLEKYRFPLQRKTSQQLPNQTKVGLKNE